MAIFIACVIAGIFLGLKRQKSYDSKPLTEAELKKIEREKREIKNFMSYTGDSQTP